MLAQPLRSPPAGEGLDRLLVEKNALAYSNRGKRAVVEKALEGAGADAENCCGFSFSEKKSKKESEGVEFGGFSLGTHITHHNNDETWLF